MIVEKNLYLIAKMVEEDLAVCPNVKVGEYGLSYEPYFKGKDVSYVILDTDDVFSEQKNMLETGYLVRKSAENEPLVSLVKQYFENK